MAYAVLQGSLLITPRSVAVIAPFFFIHRTPSCAWLPGVSALPTIRPASLTEFASELLPPKVPKSVIVPRSQKKPWWIASPARVELPTIWPRLFIHQGPQFEQLLLVPPSVGTSTAVPSTSQKMEWRVVVPCT